jgi:DNA polymerase/3'-5' exonuclease PolX
MNFPYSNALAPARDLCRALEPHCERLVIAGSIRRKRPRVHDIDLVAIPKMECFERTMFGAPATDLRETQFFRAVKDSLVLVAGGDKIISGWKKWPTGDVPVEIYIATPENWATLLLIRTGSAQHNIELCERARALEMQLHANGEGLVRGVVNERTQRTEPQQIPCTTEEDIFSALKLEYKPPEAR